MNETHVEIICPVHLVNKVTVIKAIRTLTGLGLKEAKDASERANVRQSFPCVLPNGTQNPMYEEQCRILRNEGVEVGPAVQKILQELRKLGSEALMTGEDELANEILQLVLAEKLRRGIRLGESE